MHRYKQIELQDALLAALLCAVWSYRAGPLAEAPASMEALSPTACGSIDSMQETIQLAAHAWNFFEAEQMSEWTVRSRLANIGWKKARVLCTNTWTPQIGCSPKTLAGEHLPASEGCDDETTPIMVVVQQFLFLGTMCTHGDSST